MLFRSEDGQTHVVEALEAVFADRAVEFVAVDTFVVEVPLDHRAVLHEHRRHPLDEAVDPPRPGAQPRDTEVGDEERRRGGETARDRGVRADHRVLHGARHEEEDDEGESEADGDVVTPEAIDEAMQEDEVSLSSEVVAEIERLLIASNGPTGPTRISDYDEANTEPDGDDDESDELLGSAITRLTGTDDPVGLSHVVSGVVQLSAEQRQALLAAPTALERLRMLKAHLDRENLLLARGIRPWVADPRALRPRRN